MAWTTTPYCQLSDVRLALGFSPSDSSADNADDQWLQALIPQVQAAIDEELGYSFQQNVNATYSYDGQDCYELLIDPCISIVGPTGGVIETIFNAWQGSDGVFVVGSTLTRDITADVKLVPVTSSSGYGVLLKRITGLPFQAGLQNYAVTGTFGHPSIPQDIKYAATRLVVHFYKLRASDYGTTPADNQFSGSLRMSSAWPSEVKFILDNHKDRGFYGY